MPYDHNQHARQKPAKTISATLGWMFQTVQPTFSGQPLKYLSHEKCKNR